MKLRMKPCSLRSLRTDGYALLMKCWSLGFFLLIQLGAVAQQTLEISGTVLDEQNQPVIGAGVLVVGTTIGAASDLDGKYTLRNVPENATISFSYTGMKTLEIEVAGRNMIDVNMETDAIGLEEVVVIGYGTARKKDLTGAVVNVRAEEFTKYQPANVQEMLRSAVPGLKIGYSTSAKNNPDFEIRGDNTIKADNNDERAGNKPLIVLDGVIFNGDLAEINVNDIETVDVLKDASAASIYGSRASNGVIVFTTKKGALGKPVIRVSSKVGFITGAKRIQTHKAGDAVMNWLTDMNESINSLSQDPWSPFEKFEDVPTEYRNDWLNANGIPGETDATKITTAWLDGFGFEGNERENYLAGRTFDWQDYLFHTGVRTDNDISVSGRTENISYYWSLGHISGESVQVGEKYSQFTSRLNLDIKVTDFLNMGINANFMYEDDGDEPIGSGGYRTSSPYDSPWQNVVYNENIPETGDFPYIYDRSYLKTAGAGSNRSNAYLNPAYISRKFDRYRIFPTMYAKLTLPLGFTVTSRLTTRLDFRRRFYYEDSANPQWGHGGLAARQYNQGYEWQSDNILNWGKQFGEHRFDFTGLVNAERNQLWNTYSSASNFSPTQGLGYNALNFGLVPSLSHHDNDAAPVVDEAITRTALMGRINYSYGNRYNLSASIRRDGYSRFGSENVHAVFPSISGAWTLTNESFMDSRPSWLSFLKLRASWGINGNSSGLGSYAAYATLDDNKYLNYDNGYFVAPYLVIDRIANPALAWEKNQAVNFALDYGILNGRVRGSIDVYASKTTDLLLDKKLPILTGFDAVTTNVGSLKNTGFDFSINTINVQTADFVWTSTLNANYNQNKIVSLTGELVEQTDENGNTFLAEQDDIDNGWFIGESKDVIWDFEIDGVYQIGQEEEAERFGLHPGDFRYIDQNNDGVINSRDKVFQGLTDNPWYLTLRNDAEWKGFDLGIVFLAKLGYKQGTTHPFNNRQDYIKNHNWFDLPYWTPQNPINTAARINSINLGGAEIYQNRSYLRFQNLSFGYTIPPNVLGALKVTRARVGLAIDNVAIFTNWLEGDPESQREMPRTYSVNVDFSF